MLKLNTTLTLDRLLRSKTRTRLIWYFFDNLDKTPGVRELSREINIQVHAVAREINFLKQANILIERKTPSKYYYTLNRESHFFPELMGLFHKSYGLGGLVMNNLDMIKDTSYIILTSYYIFKMERGKQDVDLLFVGNPKVDQVSIFLHNLEIKLGYEILYAIISEQDFMLRKEQHNPFIWNILSRPYVLLSGDFTSVLKVYRDDKTSSE